MIRNRTALIAAAALAVGALGLPASTLAQDKTETNSRQNQSSTPDSSRQQGAATDSQSAGRTDQAADTRGVRELLCSATDNAARGGGFDDFAKLFAASSPTAGQTPKASTDDSLKHLGDSTTTPKTPEEIKKLQDRAGQFQKDWKDKTGQDTHADTNKLDERVTQFRKDWKQKYAQDFQVGDRAVVYADITASDMSVGEARQASSTIHGSAGADRKDGTAGGADLSQPDARSQTPTAGTDAVRDGAQRAAGHITSQDGQRMTLSVPAYQDAQAVRVQLISGGSNTYHFAQPTPFDRQMLADNLAKHIGMVDDNKANWPNDVNVAYRLVTQHVLMAVSESEGGTQHAALGVTP